MPFWPICCESDAILFKKFRPGDRAEVVIWENSVFATDISVTGPAEHIAIFTKKRVARRDLGNLVSPVDRAHMKRPSK